MEAQTRAERCDKVGIKEEGQKENVRQMEAGEQTDRQTDSSGTWRQRSELQHYSNRRSALSIIHSCSSFDILHF